MAILNPHHVILDGLPLATVAHGLSTIRGIDQAPEPRIGLYEVAYRHGAHVDFDSYKGARTQRLTAYISPYDADGAVSHANGVAGQRRENLEDLLAILGKQGAPIAVQKLVPHPTTPAAVQTLEAEAYATVNDVDGTQLRSLDFTLIHPYPFWHLAPKQGPAAVPASIDLTRATGLAATAPVADMVFTFSGDGRVTYTNPPYGATATQYVEVVGSGGATVVVDVGARTVTSGPALAFNWWGTNSARWMEWAPDSVINLTTTGTVTVEYHAAKIT